MCAPSAVRAGSTAAHGNTNFAAYDSGLSFYRPLHAESGCAVRAEQRLAHRYDTIHHLVKPTRQAVSEVIHVRKKEFLVKQGSKSSHIYFITDGLFRCLCETNGNEDTFCFGVAGHPFLSVPYPGPRRACGRKIRKNRHGPGLLTKIYSNFAG